MLNQFEDTNNQARKLAVKMKQGTGASDLLNPNKAPTHYIDTLERFQKDYASYDKQKRQEDKIKRQQQLQRKRIQQLQRQNKRWQVIDEYDRRLKNRENQNVKNQELGIRRTANSNSLAYNPINLEYQNNPEGQRLKFKDEDSKIRGYVRAYNMDAKGNCQYNLINGENRVGVDQIIPLELNQRYNNKLYEYYDSQKLKIPSSSNSIRSERNGIF